jgi:para-nitrobenzyl esterase
MDQLELTSWVLNRLGVEAGDCVALQELALGNLVDVAVEVGDRFGLTVFSGVVDGVVMPGHPADLLEVGVAADIPLLVGSTTDEFRSTDSATPIDDELLITTLGNVLGRKDTGTGAREPLAVYRDREPSASNAELLGNIFTDHVKMTIGKTADVKVAASRAPVFAYLFATPPALHCDELAYLFRWGASDGLADQISETWVAFARTGDPNNERLPEWPNYTIEQRATMLLDREPNVVMDPLRKIRERWEEIPASF